MAPRWTDEWVLGLEHPAPGKPERVYYDPTLNKHRLVIKRTRKAFEIQAQRPAKFGPRKTFVYQIGDANRITIKEARERALKALARIADGESPHEVPQATLGKLTTLGAAWKKYQERDDLRKRTLAVYGGIYTRNLQHWAETPLKQFIDDPQLAYAEYLAITDQRGPSEATHAMRLLKSIYKFAARLLDTTLPAERNPCSGFKIRGDATRQGAAIPAKMMPAWHKQLEALRKTSPLRAGFFMLNLRLGTRPGELAKARWSEVDLKRKILTLPQTKTYLVELPLTQECIAELKKLEPARALNKAGGDFVFPARGESGHLVQLTEPKDTLSHTGNTGRHSHHTIGTRLGIRELVLDVLEGRSLKKSGSAGRGYIDRSELGPELRQAQEQINREIDGLLAGKGR